MNDPRAGIRRLVSELQRLPEERRAQIRVRAASVQKVRHALSRAPSARSDAVGPCADPLAALRHAVSKCEKCPHLAGTRTRVVFGTGNPRAPLMFVGEAPGADEDREGEPFVGRAGQLLTRIITAMGLGRGDVYIANVLKCRPDTPPGAPGNRPPTPEEMRTCLPYLRDQVRVFRPRVIVALGRTAMEGLFGSAGSMASVLGVWHEFEVPAGEGGQDGLRIPVMPTYHPAYLLRPQGSEQKPKVWRTMLQVMERLGMHISEKQRAYFQ